MTARMQQRRDTAANWTSANPTLADGEMGLETDTYKFKVGNGSTAWTSLPYSVDIPSQVGQSGKYLSTNGTTTSWQTVAGDIEGITAGTGLSGGGTSGTVTVSIDTSITADLTTAQTLTNKSLTDPKINLAFDAQTGTTYTTVLSDNGQVVTMNNASANTLSIPTNASVAYPIGTQINVLQIGAGQTTIQAVTAGTTTILSTGTTAAAPKLRTRYSMATCIKAATDTWYVVGDIA